jgi:uncharacterized membrane protein YphA (DoxX/SURF4 family)
MAILVQLSRILTGALFIFSGMIKANDPVGFAVKLEDYFAVFDKYGFGFFTSPFMEAITLPMAWFLVVLEVILGLALLLGVWRKSVAALLLAMILFFTWLTGFSAITGEVTDCGCFGDAIPLTPWQSFQKDIVLTVLIGIIFMDVFFRPKVIKPLFGKNINLALMGAGTIFCAWFATTAINHLPFWDFRAYKVGTNIIEGMELPPDAKKDIIEILWTYENNASGEIAEFRNEDLPEDLAENWTFIGREDEIIQEGDVPPIHDFILNDASGKDQTDLLLGIEDVNFYIISPDLEKTSIKAWEQFNAVQQAAEAEGIHSFALVGADMSKIDSFRHQVQASYPFYTADYKTLKTILRTNPGIVLIDNATILEKWSWRDLPDFEKIKAKYFPDRETRPLASLQKNIFEPGQDVLQLLASGDEDYSGLALMDTAYNDFTDSLLNLSAEVIVVPDLGQITADNWPQLSELIAASSQSEHFYVLTGSDPSVASQMQAMSGVNYSSYFADAELLSKIGDDAFIAVAMENGRISRRWNSAPQ